MCIVVWLLVGCASAPAPTPLVDSNCHHLATYVKVYITLREVGMPPDQFPDLPKLLPTEAIKARAMMETNQNPQQAYVVFYNQCTQGGYRHTLYTLRRTEADVKPSLKLDTTIGTQHVQ